MMLIFFPPNKADIFEHVGFSQRNNEHQSLIFRRAQAEHPKSIFCEHVRIILGSR